MESHDMINVQSYNLRGVEEENLVLLVVGFQAQGLAKVGYTFFEISGFLDRGVTHQHGIIHKLLVSLSIFPSVNYKLYYIVVVPHCRN